MLGGNFCKIWVCLACLKRFSSYPEICCFIRYQDFSSMASAPEQSLFAARVKFESWVRFEPSFNFFFSFSFSFFVHVLMAVPMISASTCNDVCSKIETFFLSDAIARWPLLVAVFWLKLFQFLFHSRYLWFSWMVYSGAIEVRSGFFCAILHPKHGGKVQGNQPDVFSLHYGCTW